MTRLHQNSSDKFYNNVRCCLRKWRMFIKCHSSLVLTYTLQLSLSYYEVISWKDEHLLIFNTFHGTGRCVCWVTSREKESLLLSPGSENCCTFFNYVNHIIRAYDKIVNCRGCIVKIYLRQSISQWFNQSKNASLYPSDNFFSRVRVGAMKFCEDINHYINKGVRNVVSVPMQEGVDTFTRSGVNASFSGGVLSGKLRRCPPRYWETQTWPAFMSSAEQFVCSDQFPEQG